MERKRQSGSLPVIHKVHKAGFFDFRHVDGATWNLTRKQFAEDEKSPMMLPSWTQLGKFGKRSDLRLLLSDIIVDIQFNSHSKPDFQYRFGRGYITDLASVPGAIRSFVDNDDIDIILAALVHDRNFSTHPITFNQTNELFYKMFLARRGVPGSDEKWVSLPRRAKFAWWAVRSFVGRLNWRRMKKRRRVWTLATSTFKLIHHD